MQKLLDLLLEISGDDLAQIEFHTQAKPNHVPLPELDIPKIDNKTPFLHIKVTRTFWGFEIPLRFVIKVP